MKNEIENTLLYDICPVCGSEIIIHDVCPNCGYDTYEGGETDDN